MANADFSREQNQTSGGFDSGSYREAKRPDTEAVRLTPLQQKLAGLEKALPAALSKAGHSPCAERGGDAGGVRGLWRCQGQGKV